MYEVLIFYYVIRIVSESDNFLIKNRVIKISKGIKYSPINGMTSLMCDLEEHIHMLIRVFGLKGNKFFPP